MFLATWCFNYCCRGPNTQISCAVTSTHFAELHTLLNLLHFLPSILDHLLQIVLNPLHLSLNTKTRIKCEHLQSYFGVLSSHLTWWGVHTFLSWLSRSTGTVLWQRWSVSVHSTQTHLWSLWQNSSKSLWCFLHILFSSIATGSISLWIFKVATLQWGSRWSSQYDVKHVRQDFRALVCPPTQTSQCMSLFVIVVTPFCLLALICSDISFAKEFSQSSGRPSKTVWHLGQSIAWWSSQCVAMQEKQKLWPQGMETGSEKTSWQMLHWNCTSDRGTLQDAMTSQLQKEHQSWEIVEKSNHWLYESHCW